MLSDDFRLNILQNEIKLSKEGSSHTTMSIISQSATAVDSSTKCISNARVLLQDQKLFNHVTKCRLCLASFDGCEHQRVRITEKVKERIAVLIGIKVSFQFKFYISLLTFESFSSDHTTLSREIFVKNVMPN